MNGDDVRTTWLRRASGYSARQVDDLLRRIAAELDAGRPPEPLVSSAVFQPDRSSDRYEAAAVDWFLEQFLTVSDRLNSTGGYPDPWQDLPVANLVRRPGMDRLADPPGKVSWRDRWQRRAQDRRYFEEDCERAYVNFDQVQGMRLHWHSAGELRTTEQETVASRLSRGFGAAQFTAGGRTFKHLNNLRPSRTDPFVAALAASGYQDYCGHFDPISKDSARYGAPALEKVEALVDQTGRAALWITGASFKKKITARITFPDGRWLRFLVRGISEHNGIMTAVDPAGNAAIRFRNPSPPGNRRRHTEIVLHPDRQLTEELVLAIAMSAEWLFEYFRTSSA